MIKIPNPGLRIAYKKDYKYQLQQDYCLVTPVYPAAAIRSEYLTLSLVGVLSIKRGYAWDGPSGPALDTKNFIRGSLVHDALYQLMGEHGLDIGHREEADQLLRTICREDGMSALRAWWVYIGIKAWGGVYASRNRPVAYAP